MNEVKQEVKKVQIEAKCIICGRKFNNWGALSIHLTKIHKADKVLKEKNYNGLELKCNTCKKILKYNTLKKRAGFSAYCSYDCYRAKNLNFKFKCEICNLTYASNQHLGRHIRKEHKMEMEEYYKKYILKDETFIAKCLFCGKPVSFQSLGQGYSRFCFNKACQTKFHMLDENWRKEYSKKLSIAQKKSENSQTRLSYWLKQGYSEEEAKEKLKERQSTRSYKRAIAKFGINKGIEYVKQINEKWLNTLKNKPLEEIDRINKSKMGHGYTCSKPEKKLKKLLEESGIVLDSQTSIRRKDKRCFIIDIKCDDKIIEYFGDYWHCNPEKFEESYYHRRRHKTAKEIWEADSERIRELKEAGFKVLIVWEKDFLTKEKDVLKDCLVFLKEEKIKQSFDIFDWEIETPDGWKNLYQVHLTKNFEVYELETETNKKLRGANKHILYDKENRETFLKDLKKGDFIQTIDGIEKIKRLESLKIAEPMYDISVEGEIYYSNGIKSHNSTMVMIYFLWYFIFNENKRLLVLSKDLPSAMGILDMFKTGYENLPLWLQPAVELWNKDHIKAGNGCSIQCMATTENSARGGGFSRMFLDEFAVILPDMQVKFFEAVYPIVTRYDDAKMIIMSTPKGINKFHEIYMDAKNGLNSFKHIVVYWWEWPNRDKAWKENQIKSMGLMTFNQEYGNKFLGSSQTLIDGEFLYRMEYKHPIRVEMDGKLQIYEEIDPEAFYILGADSSTGTGNDPAVISVIRINDINDIRQVAVFSDEYAPPYKFAKICIDISNMFNGCEMIVEANDPGCGSETCRYIWNDYECEKLLNTDRGKLGTNPNVKTKLLACMLLKRLLEAGCLKIYDKDTIDELGTFEEKTRNRFEAARGKHDDRVSSLYWALYYLITPFSEFNIELIRHEINEQFKELNEDEELPNMNNAHRRGQDWWGDGIGRKIPEGVRVPGQFQNSFVSIEELRSQAEHEMFDEWGSEFDVQHMLPPEFRQANNQQLEQKNLGGW